MADCAVIEARSATSSHAFQCAQASPGGWCGRNSFETSALEEVAADVLDAGPLALDNAARLVATGSRRLVVIDDIDVAG